MSVQNLRREFCYRYDLDLEWTVFSWGEKYEQQFLQFLDQKIKDLEREVEVLKQFIEMNHSE